MLTQTIQATVESTIKSLLRDLGYFKIVVNEIKPSSIEILADGKLRDIWVEVIIGIGDKKIVLSKEEIKQIKKTVKDTHRELWTAVVNVNEKGELANYVEWSNLSE